MFPGPVFRFELVALARRRRYYVLRFLYGVLLLWIVWESYSNAVHSGSLNQATFAAHDATRVGRVLFASVAFAQALAVLVVTPALTAGAIADEKQRKTLHYLLASCLGSGEIVLGKLGSRLATAGVFLSLTLPVLSLLSLTGGVDPVDVVLLYIASVSTTLLIASFSAVVSVHAKRPRDAVATVYLYECVWLFGPTLAGHLVRLVGYRAPVVQAAVLWAGEMVGATSPFYVVFDTGVLGRSSSARLHGALLQMTAAQVAVASLLMALAVVRLRPAFRREGARPLRTGPGRAMGRLWWRARPACGDDPLLWKELATSRTGLAVRVASALMGLCAFGLVGYWTVVWAAPVVDEIATRGYWASMEDMGHDQFNVYVRLVSAVLLAGCQLVAAAAGSSGLTSEREADTWVSLIATPLTPYQIIRAKMLGAFWATRLVALLWLSLVLTGAALGCVHPIGVVAAVAAAGVAVWFAAAVGLAFSLRARSSSRALTGAIATLLVLNGLYLILFIPFSFDTALPLFGVSPITEAMSIVSYGDVGLLPGVANRLDLRVIDLILTVFLSDLMYGLLAAGLTYTLVADFDRVIDRPLTFDLDVPRRDRYRAAGRARMRHQYGVPDSDTA